MYELLLMIGGIGFLAVALLGLSHGGAGHHGGAHGSSAHGHLGGHGPHHGVGASSHGHAHHGGMGKGIPKPGKGFQSIFTLLSPVTLFSLALGAGAAGVLLQ